MERSGIAMAERPKLPPLTRRENEYLDEYYDDEAQFLNEHGLSIQNKQQRLEGRAKLKACIAEDEQDDIIEEMQENPASHAADHAFSQRELQWIKKHYRHSGNFMLSQGLKPWEDQDCREAGKQIKSLM